MQAGRVAAIIGVAAVLAVVAGLIRLALGVAVGIGEFIFGAMLALAFRGGERSGPLAEEGAGRGDPRSGDPGPAHPPSDPRAARSDEAPGEAGTR